MQATQRTSKTSNASPALVALAGWVLPGLGYLLIRQRARGITIGLTVIVLFVAGLLIGGIRIIEVPGWGSHGQHVLAFEVYDSKQLLGYVYGETAPREVRGRTSIEGWALATHPMEEIRAKPWSIAQVMAGPISLLADAGAIVASRHADAQAIPSDEAGDSPISQADAYPAGARSHARVNEIGVLYTAIAGMLNLLAIIDAAHRSADRKTEAPQEEK